MGSLGVGSGKDEGMRRGRIDQMPSQARTKKRSSLVRASTRMSGRGEIICLAKGSPAVRL